MRARAWTLPFDDVDTDQIIPARFLKSVSREGLGKGLFAERGRDPGFAARPTPVGDTTIMFVGANFGCGSSREHAVWALLEAGVCAVFAPSFASIFRANAARNGLLAAERPSGIPTPPSGADIDIDLGAQTLRIAGAEVQAFAIDAFDRHCLLHAVDELGFLLEHLPAIKAYEATRDPVPSRPSAGDGPA